MIKKVTIDPYPDPNGYLLGRDAGHSTAYALQDILSQDTKYKIKGMILTIKAYTDAAFWDALRVRFINRQVGRLCIKLEIAPPCDSHSYSIADIWSNIESVHNMFGIRCLVDFAKYPYISKQLMETYQTIPKRFTRTRRLLKISPVEIKSSTLTMRLTKLHRLGFILRRYHGLKGRGRYEYSWSNPFGD